MMCKMLLSWTLLLAASGPLLSHPIADSAEMSYSLPGSLEEGQAASHDEMPLTNQAYLSPSGMYLSYPAMATGEFSENDLRAAGILPEGAIKKVVFKKQSRLNPFGHFLGTRRQFRKRENASECFWKYCV
ncbi:prepro-urotensin II-beta isoform X2 [Brienomyrus brachyistius]|uniref:prepro-urotensin II-beta isoform X2 n=1 Tax=Brienomyrus brachyistius TaxID=42636 RepID=UPI0020B3E090|nr:prepro-urotensin II-beta isoform X2 [Brienomyrus brachyistius]